MAISKNIKNLSKKIIQIGKYALVIGALITFASYLNSESLKLDVSAGSGYCPEGMTPQACLEYLQQEAQKINKELGNLENKISDEAYSQLTLYEKLSYFNNIIANTQSSIDLLEIEIEQNNIEIRLLNDEIKIIEENIYVASQEISRLQGTLEKRVGISYKYSSYSTLELLLNSSEIETLSRKIQYLKQTREYDLELLESMSDQVESLRIEKEVLASKKLDVQNKQKENETKKSELFVQRIELDSQKAEQQVLIAESKGRQSEYESSLVQLQQVQDGVTAQITQLIFQLYQAGQIPVNSPVSAGDIVGLQGMTGIITGSHLHFEYRVNGVITNPNSNGCLSVGGYNSYIGAGTCSVPLDGALVTQFPHSNSYAIDAVSTTGGSQPGQYVWGEAISCLGYYIPEGWRSTRGDGAFVRAIADGMVSAVQTDVCGGKYVIVDHGNGVASLYLHLK